MMRGSQEVHIMEGLFFSNCSSSLERDSERYLMARGVTHTRQVPLAHASLLYTHLDAFRHETSPCCWRQSKFLLLQLSCLRPYYG